jgi:hypothetical protein
MQEHARQRFLLSRRNHRNRLTQRPRRAQSRPAARMTYADHTDDLAIMRWFQDRGKELLEAAGARRIWAPPVQETAVGVHLPGTGSPLH